MAFTEEDINGLIKEYLEKNSITLSNLSNIDTSIDGEIWVFGTRTIKGEEGQDDKHESVKIKLSELKGKDGETTQEVSVYAKSEEQPGTPEGDKVPPDSSEVPKVDWLLKQDSEDGVWWVSKGTFVVKINDEDPKVEYIKMIGGWSIPNKITVIDGTTTTEKFRYYASKSATKPPSISSEYLNNPNTPGDGWEEKYELVIDPSVLKDGVARYNTNAKPPIYLWETKAVALNGNELLVPWSEPILKSAYGGEPGEPGETPVLTPILNIETSGQFMECDSNKNALPGQVIKITAKPQNFGDLDASNVSFKITPYNIEGGVISIDSVDRELDNSEFPLTAELKSDKWDSAYARVEVTCTIKKDGVTRTATATIFRYSNAKDGDNVIFGYLNPPSISLVADEQDGIDYEDFRGQFILLDGGVTIIDAETNNADVTFDIKDVTDGGFDIAIVQNREWRDSSGGFIRAASETESDGMFKITGDSSNYRNMSATIESVHRNFKSPALFTVNKIKDSNAEPPVQNTKTHERIFTLTRDRTNPTIEIKPDYLTSERYQSDNFIPNSAIDGDNVTWTPVDIDITWYGEPQDVDEINTHQWVSERFKTNGEWGAFEPPYLWTNYFIPKPETTPQLSVFLENPMDVFKGVKGANTSVFIRSYLGSKAQTPEVIQIGENVGINKGEYGIFNFEITPGEKKIVFTLKDDSEYATGEIPINVKVNGVDYLLFFKYIISPRGEGGKTHVIKLTPSSVTFTRDLTDPDTYTWDSDPEFITVEGHHLNMNELKWSFQVDGAGDYVEALPPGVVKGLDHVITIETAKLKTVSKSLNIKLKGKCEGTKTPNGDDVYLWDIVNIRAVFNGQNGVPGKTPFTLVWEEGDPHRNTSEYVDYIYYRGDENQEKNGWFRLKDEHEGTYPAPESPYIPGGLLHHKYIKIDSAGTKAFDLVIAEEANLAGFVFKNNKLYSQDILTVDGKTLGPKMMLDGVNGEFTALKAKIKGEITAEEGKIGGFDLRNGYLMGQHRVYADGDSEGSLVVTTGLNANASVDSIAFWAGGTHEKAKKGEVGAIIRHDGTSKFTGVDITGKITATEGKIGGFEVRGNNLIGHNEAEVETLGLNANADDANNDGIAFWAGAPTEGKVKANTIIRHDGSSKFTNTDIVSGTIGRFRLEEGYLLGHDNTYNVTTGLNANKDDNNIAFWAGGSLAEMSAPGDASVAYITHDGKSVFTNANISGKITATEGYIGSWEIAGSELKTTASDAADGKPSSAGKITIEDSGNRFLRINHHRSSLISVRTDRSTAMSIYTQDRTGVGLSIIAQTGATAISSHGGHNFVQRGGEMWNSPGVLAIVQRQLNGLSGDTTVFTQKWMVGPLEGILKLNRNKDNMTLTHNLGHKDYVLTAHINAGNGEIDVVSTNLNTVSLYLAGSYNESHVITLTLFGRSRVVERPV